MFGRAPLRSLDDVMLLAWHELLTNDTITSYTMVDGRERRRPANPWLPMRRSLEQVKQAALAARPAFEKLRLQAQAALDSIEVKHVE